MHRQAFVHRNPAAESAVHFRQIIINPPILSFYKKNPPENIYAAFSLSPNRYAMQPCIMYSAIFLR